MKRLIAKRRLKHGCDKCGKQMLKGHIYYRGRTVSVVGNNVYAFTTIHCARCKYKNGQRRARFKRFKEKCTHPEEFIDEIWNYIPGEAVKEPNHSRCRLCGSIVKS